MSDSQMILKMIETVSPDDTAMLDEIDARVWCFLGGGTWGNVEPVKFVSFGDYLFEDKDEPTKSVLTFSFKGKWPYELEYRDCIERLTLNATHTRYTRSRDALKAIRPEGWDFVIGMAGKYATGGCVKRNVIKNRPSFNVDEYDLPTEELAELHAIIQAIDYERSQS